MGRKSRRSILTQEKNIKKEDDSQKNESLFAHSGNSHVKLDIENKTHNTCSTSAKKKKRRKRQKKKYKEKKQSQIQIMMMPLTKAETNNNHYASSLNREGEDSGEIQRFDEENDISMYFSEDEKSSCTIKTSNESYTNDEYIEFENFSTLQRNRIKNEKDLDQESSAIHDNARFNVSNINKYRKKISSDCFNQVLWNKQKQIRHTWFNEIVWIEKNQVANHIRLQSDVEHYKSASKIESNRHDNSKSKTHYDDYDKRGNRNKSLAVEMNDSKHHNFILENKSETKTMHLHELGYNFGLECNKIITNQKKRHSNHIFNRASLCNNKANKYNGICYDRTENIISKSEEIFALSLKLHQIKTRLWPAAVECSKILEKRSKEEIGKSNSIKHTINSNVDTNSEQSASEKTNRYCTSTCPSKEFEKARRACNPFEELGEGRKGGLNNLFLNRSAMKLVNLDAILNFSLVQISLNDKLEHLDDYILSESSMTSKPIIQKTAPFRFVDLCGAPGGFTEYILYQCNRQEIPAQGWGLSLIGENKNGPGLDWKLQSHKKGQNSSFKISLGADGTGDILEWANIDAFIKEICHDCMNPYEDWYPESQNGFNGQNCVKMNMDIKYLNESTQYIDLVVADGGCQAQRDNSQQEELTLPMVVSEIAAALSLLKIGGKFIVKMFGFQSIPIRRVMRHLWESFDKISVIKPILSRPASAERYLVCFGYKGVQENWNGLAWRDNVLDLKYDETLRYQDEMEASEVLENYLSSIDRDILELNIKACFGILSQLESKSQKTNNKNQCMPPKSTLNIDMYREAWKLI